MRGLQMCSIQGPTSQNSFETFLSNLTDTRASRAVRILRLVRLGKHLGKPSWKTENDWLTDHIIPYGSVWTCDDLFSLDIWDIWIHLKIIWPLGCTNSMCGVLIIAEQNHYMVCRPVTPWSLSHLVIRRTSESADFSGFQRISADWLVNGCKWM